MILQGIQYHQPEMSMVMAKDDIIVGAYGANGNAGQGYVIYGQPSFASPLELSSLNGTNGFIINGGGQAGWSVASAGEY